MKSIPLCCLLYISLCCVYQIYGFIPNHLVTLILNLNLTDETVDHTNITENAILQVARDLLKENPNANLDSTMRINSIDHITAENLIQAYSGTTTNDLSDKFRDAIKEVTTANEAVDLDKDQRMDAAAHFHSERIQAGHNRLVELKNITITAIRLGNYGFAREQAGCLLHTLQDFYSHTNWVELGKTEPNDKLGQMDKNPDNVADKDERTCVNCVKNGAMIHYQCVNNIIVDKLTSGYSYGTKNAEGDEIEKPEGKCSHGGIFDISSDLDATGGINKDSALDLLSPHYYLHSMAVSIATVASAMNLRDIRSEVNNDTKFASFLGIGLMTTNSNISQPTIASIAYVIDTTGSMREELPEIQATLPKIKMEIENYTASLGEGVEVNLILVPFNDPDPGDILITTDIDVFLNGIINLIASGGGDCPEPSIGATIRAARASEKDSPIYVYTDAPASDDNKVTELKALITDTGVSVYYVITSGCSRRRRSQNDKNEVVEQRVRNRRQSGGLELYSEIAAFSGGQVFYVETSQISELASLIFLSSQRSFTPILQRSGTESISINIYFPVDLTIKTLIIALNGNSINATVRAPGGVDLSSLDPSRVSVDLSTTNTYSATVNIAGTTSLYGSWGIDFTSSGTYSISISGLSTLGLSYQLYQLDTESLYGFSRIEGNPTQGQTLVVLVTASGDFGKVELNNLDILTSNGTVHQQFALTKISEKAYGGIITVSLNNFQFAIVGTDTNGNQIRRVSGTGVQIADVGLSLGEESFHYNSLYPGNSSNVTLVLSNLGDLSTFLISITHDNDNSAFSYTLNTAQITLNTNETSDIVIIVTASSNASDGDIIEFIVTVSTANNERSNYLSFLYLSSTIPPPNITENIISISAAENDSVTILLLMFALATSFYLMFF